VQLPSFLSLNKKKILPFIVCFCALFYLAFLLSSTQADVFFSGDGGMKYLIINQIKAGKGFMYMHLDQPEWVRNVWVNGYFPFHDPFLYPSPKGSLFSFPPYFQLVSAFFYARFGYWGLYILPVISTVLLWSFLVVLLRRCGITTSKIVLAIFILVFCSPLTLYGATYWEHMPAVLLLFGGVVCLTAAPAGAGMGFLLGLCSGLAVFLRPEALVLNGLYAAGAGVMYWVKRRAGDKRLGASEGAPVGDPVSAAVYPAFIAGIGVPVVGFFIANYMLFGSVLGVHSYQVLRDRSFVHELLRGGKNFFVINILSVRYFPFVLLLIPVLYRIWKRGLRPGWPVLLLSVIVVIFCGISPFLVPNEGGRQWGARYFLPVVPMVIVLILLVDKQMAGGGWRWPGWAAPLMLMVTGYAFFLNTVLGGEYELRRGNQQRVKPALEYVRAQPEQVIVAGSEYIPMEMAADFSKRYFFWAESDSSFQRLVPLLKNNGVRECLYVSEEDRWPVSGKGGLVKKGNYYFVRFVIP